MPNGARIAPRGTPPANPANPTSREGTHTIPKNITIDGVTYVPDTDKAPSPVQIVVAQRGWNLIGHTHTDEQTGDLVITDAYVIRRWGTTKGLGQLAIDGKQPETILDPAGTCRIPAGAVVLVIDCDESMWSL